jgi:hypothetical protein
MKVIDPGHIYLAEAIDGGDPVRVHFPKREGPNYPGNTGTQPGPLTQEYLRICLNRALYMNAQGPCAETDIIIASLRTAIFAFEVRAARCRGASIMLDRLDQIDGAQTCPTCGHIQCDQTRHSRPHWSKGRSSARVPPYAVQHPPAPDEERPRPAPAGASKGAAVSLLAAAERWPRR